MEIMRLGYRSSSLYNVFDKLYRYATKPQNRMYSGDVEIAANVLLKVLHHLSNFPSLSGGGSKISFVVCLNYHYHYYITSLIFLFAFWIMITFDTLLTSLCNI
jgi:hypothetical protein